MQLIIAEKPSVALEIARTLGVRERKEGFMQSDKYIVSWCVGHLIELKEPGEYDERLQKWSLDTLPFIPEQFQYKPHKETFAQFKVLKALLNDSRITEVVNGADCAREGELIFDLVYQAARCTKPVKRLWISSLTKDEIIKGFRNLQPASIYKGLRDSAHARQRADWIIGINATRITTIVSNGQLFTVGRVQTPTLAIMVLREQEILAFVPTNYYEVVAEFKAGAGNYAGLWFNDKGTKLATLDQAQAIASKVQGKSGLIESIEKKQVREKAPLLYDLTSLQRTANARYGFSAAKTLSLAQSLYEKKLLTYPRTSSRHLSTAVAQELTQHIQAINVGSYAQFVQQILGKGSFKLTSRHVDDTKISDHHAIIPTKQSPQGIDISADEQKIYDLVVRRFLAMFFSEAIIERTSVITNVCGEKFITKGSIIVAAGWRIVDQDDTEGKNEDDKELPALNSQEKVQTTKTEALTKTTKAPNRYTESSLLGAMESAGKEIQDEELRLAMKEGGLGTPATRAAIIETLLRHEYIVREKKNLRPTAKGMALIEQLPCELLKSPELTANWEKKLADMAKGQYPLAKFMAEVKDLTSGIVSQIKQSGLQAPQDNKVPCPNCELKDRTGYLMQRSSTNGKFIYCSLGKDSCGYISDVPKNKNQQKSLSTKCPNCQGAMRLRLPKEKDHNAVLLCLNYKECHGIRYFNDKGGLEGAKSASLKQTPQESGPDCQACGSPTVKRGPFKSKRGDSYFWGCSKWKPNNAGCKGEPVWIS